MAAPLLVLVPGLLCDDSVWQPQIAGLADRARCWVAPNDGHDSLPALAAELLRQAPAERFALAGHSMGGRIALEVMRQAPERVERLALLDTGWQPRAGGEAGEAERRQRLALLAVARESGMAGVALRWLPGMVRPAAHGTAVYAQMQAMVERRTPTQFAAQVQALLDRPDASDVLARIACPTLVLCGEQDQWSPPDRHTAMAALIHRSRLVLVPDCSHMSTLEQPAAVTAALADWLTAPC
ncbi:alpha/beta fold hydrolase [Roseateles sp. LKC17W]|uniref:Alpha/beta fold hydrolase n=1 Tax=Pelomonas margarita TaxID=3299031 RepID=A0ABW7FIF5_9BURK